MAKLRADLTYKRNIEESLSLKQTMANIEIEQHINLDEQNKETDPNNIGNELDHIEDSDSDEDIEEDDDINIEQQFQNQIDRCLEIDDDDRDIDDLDIDDINVESIKHPAQNGDAKWKLDTMFKDDLRCPF